MQVKRKGSKQIQDDARKTSLDSQKSVEDSESLRQRALTCLRMASTREVSFAMRCNFHYNGQADDDSPVNGAAVMYEEKDCVHIIETFSEDWLIGRVVKEGYDIGLIPSATKMTAIQNLKAKMRKMSGSQASGKSASSTLTNGVSEGDNTLGVEGEVQEKKGRFRKPSFYPSVSVPDPTPPYEIIPLIRPVIFIGPSLKGYEVTDMMHRALIDYLKIRFDGRIHVEKLRTDISTQTRRRKSTVSSPGGNSERKLSLARGTSVTGKAVVTPEVQAEIDRLMELCSEFELMILESDALNHPSALQKSPLCPMLVYIKIGQPKVLTRLIKSRGKAQVKHMGAQLVAAEKLAQTTLDSYDIIIDENQLEDACEHLGEFLEAYYRGAILPQLQMLEHMAPKPEFKHQISIK